MQFFGSTFKSRPCQLALQGWTRSEIGLQLNCGNTAIFTFIKPTCNITVMMHVIASKGLTWNNYKRTWFLCNQICNQSLNSKFISIKDHQHCPCHFNITSPQEYTVRTNRYCTRTTTLTGSDKSDGLKYMSWKAKRVVSEYIYISYCCTFLNILYE